MARKATIAWEKIKHEYISTDVSYKDLAKKYGVSLRSIAGKAADEDWTKQKENYCINLASKLHQKTAEKQAESFAEYVSEMRSDLIKNHQLLEKKFLETISYGDAFSPRDLKSLSGMLTDLMMNYKNMLQETEGGKSTGEDQVIRWVNNEWDL